MEGKFNGPYKSFYKSNSSFLILFFILAFFFHGIGHNLFNQALALGDGFVHSVPTKIYSSTLSLWNPFVQSGESKLISIGSQTLYLPGIVIMRLLPNLLGYNVFILLHYTCAGFFLFLFLKELNLNRFASFVGGLSFMFCGFLSAHKSHHSMMTTAVWLPLILYFTERYFKEKKIYFLFYSAIAFSLCILSDYQAVSMYTGIVVFFYLLFKIVYDAEVEGEKISIKISALALCNSIIFIGGLLLSLPQILPIIESLKLINREHIDYTFFAAYSFPFKLLPTLLFPNLYGGEYSSLYTAQYFGPWNLTELAGYMGILPLIFAITAFILLRKEKKQVVFWSAIVLVGFLLVLGDSTPFYKIMYHVPIYNMFRVSARNWFEVNIAVAILSAYCVHYAMDGDAYHSLNFKGILKNLTTILGITTFAVVGTVFIFRRIIPLLDPVKINKFEVGNYYGLTTTTAANLFMKNTRFSSPAIYIPLLVITISILCLLFLHRFRNRKIFWVVIAGIIFIDLYSFGHFHGNLYPDYSIINHKENNETYSFLRNAENDFRKIRTLPFDDNNYNELWPNLNVLFGIPVLNGYGPIWLRDYKTLTSILVSGYIHKKKDLIQNNSILSALSTKYLLTSDRKLQHYVESINASVISVKPVSIVDGLNNANAVLFSASKSSEGSIILSSVDGVNPSLIHIPFKIHPNTNYKISFVARSSIPFDKELLVDLIYDANNVVYNNIEQKKFISSEDIMTTFMTYEVVLNSGESNIPPSCNLRFLTYSQIPIEIKNIKLDKIGNYNKYWGNKQKGMSSVPLYRKIYETRDGIAIYENMNYLDRARFTNMMQPVRDFNEANHIIWFDSEFNPATTSLVEDYSDERILDIGEVLKADYSRNDSIDLQVKTGNKGFLVISDTWYPGWKAYIDGKETKIYKTNGIMKGVLIAGKGNHTVKLAFRPMSFYVGLFISLVTLFVMITLIIFNALKSSKKSAT